MNQYIAVFCFIHFKYWPVRVFHSSLSFPTSFVITKLNTINYSHVSYNLLYKKRDVTTVCYCVYVTNDVDHLTGKFAQLTAMINGVHCIRKTETTK